MAPILRSVGAIVAAFVAAVVIMMGVDSFNGRLREECLNVHWFSSLEDAQQKVDAFRGDYNEHRPHRALAGLSPREYAQRVTMTAADSPS